MQNLSHIKFWLLGGYALSPQGHWWGILRSCGVDGPQDSFWFQSHVTDLQRSSMVNRQAHPRSHSTSCTGFQSKFLSSYLLTFLIYSHSSVRSPRPSLSPLKIFSICYKSSLSKHDLSAVPSFQETNEFPVQI